MAIQFFLGINITTAAASGAVFLSESAQQIFSPGWQTLWSFSSRDSQRPPVDLLVHISEWLCRLFTREPKFTGCLFGALTVKLNIRMERLNIPRALMKQCSVIITEGKWGPRTLKNSRNNFPLSLKKLEAFWNMMFLKDSVLRKSQAPVLLRETVQITRGCYSSNLHWLGGLFWVWAMSQIGVLLRFP